jgi:site-specific recombinase XerD
MIIEQFWKWPPEMKTEQNDGPVSAPSSLDRLLRSWKLSLAAGNKSQNTMEVYSSALESFQTWLTDNGHPTEARKIEKQHIEGFIAYLLASGRKPATAHNRYRALNTFFGWLVNEGVLKASPTQKVEPPMVPTQPTEVISLPVLKRLLRSMEGRDFRDRRDNAMMRLLLDSGMRREELAALKVADVDLEEQCAYVMGKGRRPRRCPFGKQTALALDRYLRMRDQHPRADSPALWLGLKGAMTGKWRLPDGRRALPPSRDRASASAPISAHVRPSVVGRGRPRGRSHAPRRLAKSVDAAKVWSLRCR